MKVDDVVVYDNKGETFDRFTVVIGSSVFTMSDNPTSPHGVNMYVGELSELDVSSFGSKLSFIPEKIKNAVLGRIP